MKTQVIKPQKEGKEDRNLITPIVYLILGLLLAFKSKDTVKFICYIIGILVIIYGIKSFVTCYQNKDNSQVKNVNLSIAIISIIIGILVILLSGILEVSIRYIIGFFLIYMGVSRLITEISFGKYLTWTNLSNVILIILGIYSVFFSNAILVIIGWILIINAVILFWEYIKDGHQ